MRAKDGVIFNLSKKRLAPQPLPLPPAGELPDPDDKLPKGSKPIFPQNKLFTGRDDYLKWLASVLLYDSPANAAMGVVITGWRGVGKSQLAAEFCYRYGRYLQGVHWVQADRDINTEIAACGEAIGIPGWPDKLEDKVNATLKAWHEDGLHLVVFDNPERDIVEEGQRPKSGPEVINEWLTRVLPAKFY